MTCVTRRRRSCQTPSPAFCRSSPSTAQPSAPPRRAKALSACAPSTRTPSGKAGSFDRIRLNAPSGSSIALALALPEAPRACCLHVEVEAGDHAVEPVGGGRQQLIRPAQGVAVEPAQLVLRDNARADLVADDDELSAGGALPLAAGPHGRAGAIQPVVPAL